MRLALELARGTVALASPNPQVGCVIVRDGRVVGEGAHRYADRDHAEIVALKQAGGAARGATAYVTLEPCAHHGRTGPCADALIAAGVARVVAAAEDPNPLVAGQGFGKLRAAGAEVAVGVLQDEAREINDAFAHFIQHRRPFVTLKAALSANGYLAPPPATRTAAEPHWLTSLEARAEVQRLRHASDAVLTGIGTVLADDPALTDRTGFERRRRLLRVVMDRNLRIPIESSLVTTARGDVLVFAASTAPQEKLKELKTRGVDVEVLSAGDGVGSALRALAARDILSVLVEAGPHLNTALLQEGLVDKVILFRSLSELGAGSVQFANVITPEALEQRLARRTETRYGPDACVTGYLHYPWPKENVPQGLGSV